MNLDWADRAVCRARLEAGLPDLHGAPAKDVHAAREARQACLGCPVLNSCAAFAVKYTWSHTTVAAWTAPSDWTGTRHPGLDVALERVHRDRRQARRAVAVTVSA